MSGADFLAKHPKLVSQFLLIAATHHKWKLERDAIEKLVTKQVNSSIKERAFNRHRIEPPPATSLKIPANESFEINRFYLSPSVLSFPSLCPRDDHISRQCPTCAHLVRLTQSLPRLLVERTIGPSEPQSSGDLVTGCRLIF